MQQQPPCLSLSKTPAPRHRPLKHQNDKHPLSLATRERRHGVGADQQRDTTDDGIGIAVIGMSGQFPDAVNVDLFWRNLITGVDGVHELPDRYLNQDIYYEPS